MFCHISARLVTRSHLFLRCGVQIKYSEQPVHFCDTSLRMREGYDAFLLLRVCMKYKAYGLGNTFFGFWRFFETFAVIIWFHLY